MIIFIYGTDGYRVKESADVVISAYKKKYKSGVNLYRFNLEQDKDYNELDSAVKSVSFFDEVKLAVIKNIFSNKTHSQNVISLINDFDVKKDKKTVLLFVETKDKKELQKANKELFGLLSHKDNMTKEIEPLSGVKLSNWVKNKFKENGQNISTPVADLLINLVGSESWALANEINKLSNYKKGGVITEEDVKLLVNTKENNDIFDLVNAFNGQNRAKAFEMMYRLINSGCAPQYLLSMLIYALTRSRRLSKEELLRKFDQLAELDVNSKDGRTNLEDALYNFTLS